MKKKSKILIALLAVALLICIATITLAACNTEDDIIPNEDYDMIQLSDGTYEIHNCRSNESAIVIPKEYNGQPVTSIYSFAFSNCTNLKEITIPDSVQRIDSYAFYGCTNLKEITIPDSVTSIGFGAFSDCTSLTEITIPNSVENIDARTFWNCTGLQTATINAQSISHDAFYGCTNLRTVTLGERVQSIGHYAFSGCTGLKTATINAQSIGRDAFSDCINLRTVTLGERVQSIGEDAFGTFGDNVVGAGNQTINLNYCGTLKDWCNIKLYRTSFNCNINFYLNDVEVIEVKDLDGVKSISAYAFCNFKNIASVTIPADVEEIGWGAFSNCSSLQTATINAQSIGVEAFQNCASLQTVTISDNVQRIGSYAFDNCTRLKEITIPDNVQYISNQAFSNCTGLQTVTISEGVQSINGNAFENCTGIIRVNYLGTLKGWCEIEFADSPFGPFGSSVRLYVKEDGEDFEVTGNVNIPTGTDKIGNYAFSGRTGITSITIPDSVQSIGWRSFYGCTNLHTVYYEGTSEQWNNIWIDNTNYDLKYAKRYYFSEQDPYQNGTAVEGEEYWHWNDETHTPEVWVKQN